MPLLNRPLLGKGFDAISSDIAPKLRLEPFGYRGVHISDPFVTRQLEEIRDRYLSISDDDWLKPYRQRAGKPAPGNDLGGGYTRRWWNIFGQVLGAFSRLGATGDSACAQRVESLLNGWGACIAPDGYFYIDKDPYELHFHPHYVYDKIVGGLVDAYVYAQRPEALTYLAKVTDWAEKHLSRVRAQPRARHGLQFGAPPRRCEKIREFPTIRWAKVICHL